MTKIEALKKTIYNLENDVYEYDWSSSESCNCGVLAKTLLNGKSLHEAGYFRSKVIGDVGVFAKKAYCLTSDLPLSEVFQTLKDAGFTYKELLELEYLSNEKIAAAVGFELTQHNEKNYAFAFGKFNNKRDLIKYLKAWVEILEVEVPKERTRINYVSVPVSITEQMEVVNN